MAKGIQIELTGVHLCCRGCTDAANAALTSVDGIESHCDMAERAVTFSAPDYTAARKALDALADAGFYGSSNNSDLAMRAPSKAPQGNVRCVEVSRIHNCCRPCSEAIHEAIATVDGVTGDTVAPKATTFEVTGDFFADALINALNAAGFSARVEQRKTASPDAARSNRTTAGKTG